MINKLRRLLVYSCFGFSTLGEVKEVMEVKADSHCKMAINHKQVC